MKIPICGFIKVNIYGQKVDVFPVGLCLIDTWVRQKWGLRGKMCPTVLSHGFLSVHSHSCSVNAVPQPYKFCTSDWSHFTVSSDWLPLFFAPNNNSCPTLFKHFNQPDCGNLNLHTTQESDAHRCESQRSVTSPTLNSKVTYQPRFFFWLQPAPAWIGCLSKSKSAMKLNS